MRTDDLLEQCLLALKSGQELPPHVGRYLARHPEKRAEVEELLFVAHRVSHVPSAELSNPARERMQSRLASKLNFDPSALQAARPAHESDSPEAEEGHAKKPVLSVGRLSLAKLRYEPPASEDPEEARMRAAFRDLTPEDIRRYIGVRGEDYLYFRQRLPGWEPVFAFIAFVLRGFKRLERLTSL